MSSMSIDYIAAVQADSVRVVAALAANRDGVIPWSDTWTVQDCARHVGGLHHVMAGVVEGRPTANFGLFKSLDQPAATDPGLGPWIADGTAALVAQLRAAPPEDTAWSWWPEDQTVGFWSRRVALETLVHRWDVELGAGVDIVPADPVLAADAIDEYLDIFVGLQRVLHTAPGAGETVHVHCTDTSGEWFVEFPAPGERVLRREHAKGDVAFRGPAEGLLLYLWGRLPVGEAGVETIGDPAIAARWRELAPSI
jgi:uncharacterized protein (TIGR03083 family)